MRTYRLCARCGIEVQPSTGRPRICRDCRSVESPGRRPSPEPDLAPVATMAPAAYRSSDQWVTETQNMAKAMLAEINQKKIREVA